MFSKIESIFCFNRIDTAPLESKWYMGMGGAAPSSSAICSWSGSLELPVSEHVQQSKRFGHATCRFLRGVQRPRAPPTRRPAQPATVPHVRAHRAFPFMMSANAATVLKNQNSQGQLMFSMIASLLFRRRLHLEVRLDDIRHAIA